MSNIDSPFERTFRVWLYIVSHDQLLLRSPKDQMHTETIDLIFDGVLAMNIKTLYYSLNIRDNFEDDRSAIDKIHPLRGDDRLVIIEDSTTSGYVVCNSFRIERGNLDFWEIPLDIPGIYNKPSD